jgi:hypothetical protein
MRLAVLGERLDDVRIRRVAVGLQCTEHHAQAAVRHDGSLQRRIGLKADDDFLFAIDVARWMGGNRTRHLRDIEHTLLAFLDEEVVQLCPDALRARSRRHQEGRVAVVRQVVLLNEVPYVDRGLPLARAKCAPRCHDRRCYDFHRALPLRIAREMLADERSCIFRARKSALGFRVVVLLASDAVRALRRRRLTDRRRRSSGSSRICRREWRLIARHSDCVSFVRI